MVTLTGGDKLKSLLAEMSKNVENAGVLKVGVLEGASYPDGTSVALVAASNEYGAPAAGIPPRPAIRDMITAKSPGWAPALATILKANGYDAGKSLAIFGEGVRGQWQEAILNFSGEPLKPATIKRKGFDKQLVDTSHYVNSLDLEVSKS